MIRVILWNDGRAYVGRGAAEVVDAMRLDSAFTCGKTLDEYMSMVARTVRAVAERRDFPVRCTDPEAFLDDLEQLGLIRQETAE